jgi:hypothetical protein
MKPMWTQTLSDLKSQDFTYHYKGKRIKIIKGFFEYWIVDTKGEPYSKSKRGAMQIARNVINKKIGGNK